MIGWFSAAVIGPFQASLCHLVVPSAVRCRTALVLCFLILGLPCLWHFYSTITVDVVRVKSEINASLTVHVHKRGQSLIEYDVDFPQCIVLMLFVSLQDLSRQTMGVDQVICR